MDNQVENHYLHEVAITAIIVKDGKYLITRRAMTKKRFPGKWTVPGGKMETSDYLKLWRCEAITPRRCERRVKEDRRN